MVAGAPRTSSDKEGAGASNPKDDWSHLARTVGFDALGVTTPTSGVKVWMADTYDDKVARMCHHHSSPLKKGEKIDYFVSHAWTDPSASFGTLKVLEFENQVTKHICLLHKEADRKTLRFWMDKCCIPQHDSELKQNCVEHFEDFIRISNGAVVLLNALYLTRLWCLFEWACFIRFIHPSQIFVGFFYFTQGEPAKWEHLRLISDISLAGVRCSVEADRAILVRKVEQEFHSEAQFVRFVQLSLIALIVRDLLLGIAKNNEDAYSLYVGPFLSLCSELDLTELSDKIKLFRAWEEYAFASKSKTDKERDACFQKTVADFLAGELYPLLQRAQKEALKC